MTDKIYDLIILGAGPAGLQAAIHAARAKAEVLIMGREKKSSIARAHVENYCCMGSIDGESMLREGLEQAVKSGASVLNEDVIEITRDGDLFMIKTESGAELPTRTIILAMGISREKLRAPGEKELFGKGVSYCVDCDANFYRGEKVAIVGDESAAVSGALTMLFYAEHVHLVTRGLKVSDILAEQLRNSSVSVHEGVWVKEVLGENKVEGLKLDNGETLDVGGVFVELGAKGAIELAAVLGVALDPETMKFVVANKKQETNVPGVYAAGDICGPPWQVAKAVGEGCVAGLEAASFAKKMKRG